MAKATGVSDAGIQTKDMGLLSSEEFVFVAIPRVQYKMQGWVMWMQEAFKALAKDKEITGYDRRVLDYLMSIMDFENYIGIDQTEIAEFIEIQRPHVSRSIKKLVEKGILEEGPKIGRNKSYTMNYHYAWKGKAINRQKLIAKSYRDADPKAVEKSGAKKKTGSKKTVKKPAKSKSGKLKLIKQEDGKL